MRRAPLFALLAAVAAPGMLAAGCRWEAARAGRPAPPLRFQNVAREVGIEWRRTNGAFGAKWLPETMGGGGAFLDYDLDGWLDVLLLNGDHWPGHAPRTPQENRPDSRPLPALYRNLGGRFRDVTRTVGLARPLQAMGAAVGDVDNDGDPDLLVTTVDGVRLFRNAGDGATRRFEDVTAQSGLDLRGWCTSAAWLDYDRDGRLDLFLCRYVKWRPETEVRCGTAVRAYCRPQEYPPETCRLYRNRGDGRFEDVSRRAGIDRVEAKALGVAVCELDDSGYPSLVVASDTEPNLLFRNRGDGRFDEIGIEAGIALDASGKARAGMGVDIAECPGAGSPALAIGNFSFEGIALYDLAGSPPFPERARSAGLYQPSYPWVTFGLFFADFDSDGAADLFATNGHVEDTIERTNPGQTHAQPNLLFWNRGDGHFDEVAAATGPDLRRPLVGRAACRGDFDNDGRTDILVVANTGAPALFRNETPQRHHWIGLRLVGTRSNRDGFGARVLLDTGGRQRRFYHSGAASYLSAHDPRLLIGLDRRPQVDRLTIRWPSGWTESWQTLPADRFHILREGAGRPALPAGDSNKTANSAAD